MINLETLETRLNHHQPLSSARFESHAAYDFWKGALREGMAIHMYMIARGKYACCMLHLLVIRYACLVQVLLLVEMYAGFGTLGWYRYVCFVSL